MHEPPRMMRMKRAPRMMDRMYPHGYMQPGPPLSEEEKEQQRIQQEARRRAAEERRKEVRRQ